MHHFTEISDQRVYATICYNGINHAVFRSEVRWHYFNFHSSLKTIITHIMTTFYLELYSTDLTNFRCLCNCW